MNTFRIEELDILGVSFLYSLKEIDEKGKETGKFKGVVYPVVLSFEKLPKTTQAQIEKAIIKNFKERGITK